MKSTYLSASGAELVSRRVRLAFAQYVLQSVLIIFVIAFIWQASRSCGEVEAWAMRASDQDAVILMVVQLCREPISSSSTSYPYCFQVGKVYHIERSWKDR